ncbi:uncharacterized protein LOC115874050 isoform X2 [Sitophilus oryzae]|uniref:Uncharacterized protein LOC115874050 isoform X2 n=1 Tax=Sitophilus oryzae TaxID=7048 RepID=A0A6J2X1Z2_SITOR|nr:uncharacterized protein LOC115874050 isoform X2 [Sitophilus oryzae]
MKKAIGMHSILETKHDIFRVLRWFSVCSSNSVAHWSFFCEPPAFASPPQALLPECALNTNEPEYKGSQDITFLGLPCLPWSGYKMISDDVNMLFSNESDILASKNYCRDPKGVGDGTFCYVLNQNASKKSVEKQYCRLRNCKSQLCKMAGTGNDFIGQVSTTRANRTCDSWDPTTKSVHLNYMYNFNGSLFAEMNPLDAKNYCRNPNRDISGSWCYTTDPEIVQDVCDIKDCDRPEECIIVVSDISKGRKIFILPQWKEEGVHGGLRFSLKEWNPDLLSGFAFSFFSKSSSDELELIIGAQMNEKVELYLNGNLLERKTFPHLISAGKWTDFWLQIRRGEIMLGFKGVPTALFEWREKNTEKPFEPMFLSYRTLYPSMPIGVFFNCEGCQTENTTENNFLNFVPVGLHSLEENSHHRNLSLKLRGNGIAWVSFMWVTNNLNSYLFKLDAINGMIGWYKIEAPPRAAEGLVYPLLEIQFQIPMVPTTWTEYNFSWGQRIMEVKRNNVTVLHHENDKVLLLYWFSVAAAEGWVTWSANCEPLDLDGPPIDGAWSAWSPWTCTVSCGGGEGFRTRTCSNPHPNIFGKLCQGSPTATGRCNDFPCGDISPETLDTIRNNLQKQSYSLVVDEDDRVLIFNEKDLLKIVKNESPEAYFEWTLNGIFINQDKRVSFDGNDVLIKKAKSSDSGTYVCMIYRINRRRVVLKTVSLAVKSKTFDVDSRETWYYTLQCHAVVLGYIYTDLSLKLVIDEKVYKDYGVTTLAAVNSYFFDPLNRSHTGSWRCVVEQKDLGLKWVTNYVKINVKKRPNFYTNLMEDRLTAPIFGGLKDENAVFVVVLLFTVFVVFCVGIFIYLYMRFCTLKSRYKRNRRL